MWVYETTQACEFSTLYKLTHANFVHMHNYSQVAFYIFKDN